MFVRHKGIRGRGQDQESGRLTLQGDVPLWAQDKLSKFLIILDD